jgi:hypothetical protein
MTGLKRKMFMVSRNSRSNQKKLGSVPSFASSFAFDISAVLNREIQDLVSLLFEVHLGISFPDPVLEESCSDLRSTCGSAWAQFEMEENRGLRG